MDGCLFAQARSNVTLKGLGGTDSLFLQLQEQQQQLLQEQQLLGSQPQQQAAARQQQQQHRANVPFLSPPRVQGRLPQQQAFPDRHMSSTLSPSLAGLGATPTPMKWSDLGLLPSLPQGSLLAPGVEFGSTPEHQMDSMLMHTSPPLFRPRTVSESQQLMDGLLDGNQVRHCVPGEHRERRAG